MLQNFYDSLIYMKDPSCSAMFEVSVSIELKKGITDPEGEATLKSLHLLGFENVKSVRTEKVFKVLMEGEKEQIEKEAEEMCKKLLTNPVIHKYRISIREVEHD